MQQEGARVPLHLRGESLRHKVPLPCLPQGRLLGLRRVQLPILMLILLILLLLLHLMLLLHLIRVCILLPLQALVHAPLLLLLILLLMHIVHRHLRPQGGLLFPQRILLLPIRPMYLLCMLLLIPPRPLGHAPLLRSLRGALRLQVRCCRVEAGPALAHKAAALQPAAPLALLFPLLRR